MRLTRYTDYSLRVLMYLGVHQAEELATITEIAECYDISRNHVMKVVYELGQHGYIETLRGKGGGLRLAKPPEDINIGQLVRQTESDLHIVECFSSEGRCRLSPACVLKGALGEALGAFLRVLDAYTLADLIAPQRDLRTLLAPPN